MKNQVLFMMIVSFGIMLSSCGGDTTVVDSGTYKGEIKKVEPAKTEIYVTIEDDKTLELYFTDETTLTRNGAEVKFSELSKGQSVQVEVKKVGKKLEPQSVKILE